MREISARLDFSYVKLMTMIDYCFHFYMYIMSTVCSTIFHFCNNMKINLRQLFLLVRCSSHNFFELISIQFYLQKLILIFFNSFRDHGCQHCCGRTMPEARIILNFRCYEDFYILLLPAKSKIFRMLLLSYTFLLSYKSEHLSFKMELLLASTCSTHCTDSNGCKLCNVFTICLLFVVHIRELY